MIKLVMPIVFINVSQYNVELTTLENEFDQLVLASLCPPLGTLLCNPVVIQFHGWGGLSTLPAVTLAGQDNPTLRCAVIAIELY